MLALSVLVPDRAIAAEIEEVVFADRFERRGMELPVRGLGLLRYRILFRGYVGALYLPEDTSAERIFDDVPKRLELSYFWSIDKDLFAEAGNEVLRRNVEADAYAGLEDRLEQLNAAYRDVEPGDRYALTYQPGVGTELALNGEPLTLVRGADFAAAYFKIWLGDAPVDEGFRDALLGRGP